MDINTIRGLFTLLLIVVFAGIVAWAWSSRRKREFDAASRLPLDNNEPPRSGDG